jgi:hypothetical protein
MFRYENYYKDVGSGLGLPLAGTGKELWHRNRFTNAVCPIDQDCFFYTFPNNLKPWHCIGNLTKDCKYNWGTPEEVEELTR